MAVYFSGNAATRGVAQDSAEGGGGRMPLPFTPVPLGGGAGAGSLTPRVDGTSRSDRATQLMAALVRCGPPPPVGIIRGEAPPEEIAKLRRLSLLELQCLKLMEGWLERPIDVASDEWAYFQQVAPYSWALGCEAINAFSRLSFRASALLSELRVPFGRRPRPAIDVDKLKLRLFYASNYLEEFLKEGGRGNYDRKAIEKIELLQRELKDALSSIRSREKKRFAKQINELSTILKLLHTGLWDKKLLLVLLQPMKYQYDILIRNKELGRLSHKHCRKVVHSVASDARVDNEGIDRLVCEKCELEAFSQINEEEAFPRFFGEVVNEASSLSQVFMRFAQSERKVIVAAIRRKKGKKEARQWDQAYEAFLTQLKTYSVVPLENIHKEMCEDQRERIEMQQRPVDAEYLRFLQQRVQFFHRLKGSFSELCDRFNDEFKPVEKIKPLLAFLRLIFAQEPSLGQLCPFFFSFESHWNVFIGRVMCMVQKMYEPLYIAELESTRVYKGFAMRVESLFPKKPLVCALRDILEYNLVMGQARALVRELIEHLSYAFHEDLFSLFQRLNYLEEVFADLGKLLKKDNKAGEESALRLYQTTVDACLERHLPCLEKGASERGMEIIGQLRAAFLQLQTAPVLFEGGASELFLLAPFTCSRSSDFDPDEMTLTFFRREIEVSLWALEFWNRRAFEVDEVPPDLLHALPPYIQVEIRTYIEQLTHEMRRFRRLLSKLQRKMESLPLTTKKDLIKMAELLMQQDEAFHQFDFDSVFQEIFLFFTSYRSQVEAGGELDEAYEGVMTYFTKTFFDKVAVLEGFYLTTIFFPNTPLKKWAEFERFFREEEHAPAVAAAAAEVFATSSDEEEQWDVSLLPSEHAALAAGVAVPLEVGVSFKEFFFVLMRWVRRQEAALRRDGGGASPTVEDVRRLSHQTETIRNLFFYLRALEEWNSGREKLERYPLSWAKGILLNGALMVEQTLKHLLVQSLRDVPSFLLETHSIAQLLQAFPHSSRLNAEESRHLINLGRFTTEGSRSLSHPTNPQVMLLLRVLQLKRKLGNPSLEARDEEELREKLRGCLEEIKQDVAKAFQSLAKLCGEDISSLSGVSPFSPEVTERGVFGEVAARESDKHFQREVVHLVERMEKGLAKGRAVGRGNGIEIGRYFSRVQRKRKQVTQRGERVVESTIEMLNGVVMHLHQPQIAFTLSHAALFESCRLFEHVVKSLMAMHAMPQSTNPFDHLLWERNPRNGRLYLHEHRLFDLWNLLKHHLRDGELTLTREQERALELLNGFGGGHRYLGSQRGGVAQVFQRLAFLSHCYRQLQAGWILPDEDQEKLVAVLGGERDREKWLGTIQEAIHRIQDEIIFPNVSHLLEAAAMLLEYQSAKLTTRF